MTIGSTISTLRKKYNMTQEQLANAVGVSIPAVSKWESNSTTPDISLLAPIARILKTDLNDLLSFKEDLALSEVDLIMKQVKETFKNKGYKAGITQVFDFLQEYPNNDMLQLEAVTAVTSYSTLKNDLTEEAYRLLLDKSLMILEELCHSKKTMSSPIIRPAAYALLTMRYLQANRAPDAESLLTQIPEAELDGKQMLASFYVEQGKYDLAKNIIQKNMLTNSFTLINNVSNLFTISLNQQHFALAKQYASDYKVITKTLSIAYALPSFYLFELHCVMDIVDEALESLSALCNECIYLNGYSKEVPSITRYNDTIIYSIVTWSNASQDNIGITLYNTLLNNPIYTKILETEQGHKHVERLKVELEMK